MKRRPLFKSKKYISPFKPILLALLDGRNTENAIYRKLVHTGLPGLKYKQKIIHAINYLERGGFVLDVLGQKRYGKGEKQPKELTPLGRELAELIYSIDQYYKSYSKLTNAIVEKLFDIPYTREAVVKAIKGILRDKGLSDKTIDPEEVYSKTILLTGIFSPKVVSNAVVIRYVHVISKSNLNDDKVDEIIKQDILNEVLTNAISEHLSFMFKTNKDRSNLIFQRMVGTEGSTFKPYDINFRKEIYETIELISNDYYLNNSIVEKEIIDAFAAFISILEPSVEFIDWKIDNLKKLLNRREKAPINESEVKRNRKLLTLFEECKTRKNNMMNILP